MVPCFSAVRTASLKAEVFSKAPTGPGVKNNAKIIQATTYLSFIPNLQLIELNFFFILSIILYTHN
jgi:hypothetical protein